MPLVLVTTVGADANASVSAAEAAAFAEAMFPPPLAWYHATGDEQNRALATAYQRLGQERGRCLDRLTDEIAGWSSWPAAFQKANALLAFEMMRLWKADPSSQVTGPSGHAGISSVSTPELSITLELGGGAQSPLERYIAHEIRPLLHELILSPSQVRMVRG